MARKVFLSFLGASFYSDTIYYSGDFSYTTKYIQASMLELLKVRDWSSDDAVRIFVTDRAYDDNWCADKTTRLDRSGEEKHYVRLQKIIEDMHLKASVRSVHVPDGKNDKEIWDIFNIMFNEIENGDELYIDLTHGFRYLPMLMLVFADYAKFLKNTKIVRISYGNWEAKDAKGAPIFDFASFVQLQDWTTAASNFISFGNTDKLETLSKSIINENVKANKNSIDRLNNIRKFIKRLSEFTNERLLCQGEKIEEGKKINEIYEFSEKIDKTDIAPLDPILSSIKNSIILRDTPIERILDAVDWCLDKKLYQQSVTLLQEGVVSYFCRKYDELKDYVLDGKKRGLVNSAFDVRKKPENEWKIQKTDFDLVRKLIKDEQLNKVAGMFSALKDVRNTYNHACYQKKQSQIKIDKIKEWSKKFRDVLCEKSIASEHKEFPPVFLNLSNHPSAEWEKEQIDAARKYGEVVDEQFPQVNPEDSIDDIKKLAEKTAVALVERYGNEALTVHVMGEMTLTCELVRLLKDAGVRCLASCTQRNVEDKGNGDKVSHFKFVQFREY